VGVITKATYEKVYGGKSHEAEFSQIQKHLKGDKTYMAAKMSTRTIKSYPEQYSE
jgi:hypothetical protein